MVECIAEIDTKIKSFQSDNFLPQIKIDFYLFWLCFCLCFNILAVSWWNLFFPFRLFFLFVSDNFMCLAELGHFFFFISFFAS